jgi:hypothetical protein
MERVRDFVKLCVQFYSGFVLILVITACGTVQHNVKFNPDYRTQAGTRLEVAAVSNQTKETFDVDIERMLADALSQELREQDLLWTGQDGQRLLIKAQILEYSKGDAFKRWLAPGAGATVLTVSCDLLDGDQCVGTAQAKRTVSAGGLYTVGAWRTVFNSVAKDLAEDLRSQLAR